MKVLPRLKFLIDAHLPKSIIPFFVGQDVIHTLDLPEANATTDQAIITLSIKEKRIVITKDDDFHHSYINRREPYKLVLVKLGNMRLADLKSYFQRNAMKIVELLIDHSYITLELNEITVIDESGD